MRTPRKTKREMAVSAAILDVLAAQVLSECDHECIPKEMADDLELIGQELRNMSTALFVAAGAPGRPKIDWSGQL